MKKWFNCLVMIILLCWTSASISSCRISDFEKARRTFPRWHITRSIAECIAQCADRIRDTLGDVLFEDPYDDDDGSVYYTRRGFFHIRTKNIRLQNDNDNSQDSREENDFH